MYGMSLIISTSKASQLQWSLVSIINYGDLSKFVHSNHDQLKMHTELRLKILSHTMPEATTHGHTITTKLSLFRGKR